MVKRILATLEIARPHNMVAAGACVYSAYHLTGGRGFGPAFWAVVFTALVAGLGNLVNDFFDYEIDRVNKPHRPIPSGRLTRIGVIRTYAIGTLAVTVPMFFLLPRGLVVTMTVWEALLFFYAAKAKRIPLAGNLLIATICASAFFVGAQLTGGYRDVVFPFCFAFVLVMGRELIKGAEDVEGDGAVGARTLAVRFGVDRAAKWGAILLLICAVTAPVPALIRSYGRLYGLLIELLVVPGVLGAAHIVLRSPERAVFNRGSWILKVEMFLGILVMGMGRM